MSFEKLASSFRLRDVKTCLGIGFANQSLLCKMAGHGDAGRTTILVDAGLPDNALDGVATLKRLAESFQDY